MNSLQLAILNLSRRRVPTLIAVAAIAISVACAGILLRLNLLSQDRFAGLGRGGDALVGAKAGGIEMILNAFNGEGEYPGFLPYKLYESLHAQQTVQFEDGAAMRPSTVKAIIPFLYFGQLDGYRAVGTDEVFLNRPRAEDSLPLADGRWVNSPNEVVLGSTVAHARGAHVGDTVGVLPWAGGEPEASHQASANNPPRAMDMRVAGILKPTGTAWDRMLYSSVATAQGVLAGMDLRATSIWGPNVLNYFLVYLDADGFAGLSSIVNRRTVGEAVRVDEQKQRLRELSGTGEKLGFFVTILILALSALSVMSMLITRFEAMSIQLAVLRALGYSKRVIGGWLLWEGFLLGTFAVFIGLALDFIGFPFMRALLGSALPPADVVQSSILYSFPIWITAILATTASVFLPLYRVFHQDVHFSLRS